MDQAVLSSENVIAPSLREIASWPPSRAAAEAGPSGIVAGIPSLQRGLVWKPGQVEMLWDSLMRGFPVGAFVTCRRLERQNSRGAGTTDVTHHLLDGQQRAQAIKLGFEDPFEIASDAGQPAEPGQILWLDLQPGSMPRGYEVFERSTRSFLFRLTTKAHPWGFQPDDAANRLPVAEFQEAVRAGSGDAGTPGNLKRPTPIQYQPVRAGVPIPLGWLLAIKKQEQDTESFWRQVSVRTENLERAWSLDPRVTWPARLRELLNGPSADGAELMAVWKGLDRLARTQVLCLNVPDEALASDVSQKTPKPGREIQATEVIGVEHLFNRLNASGTRIDGDELAWSLIKAHRPNLEKPVDELVRSSRLPAARLVTLAARIPLVSIVEPASSGTGRKLSTALSVADFRRFERDWTLGKETDVFTFIDGTAPVSLARVIDRLNTWTASGSDGVGLPPVLQSSIARRSPNVFALLMWIAKRSVTEDFHGSTAGTRYLRRPILALVTTLHWFGVSDKKDAVDTVVRRLSSASEPLRPESLTSVLAGLSIEEGLNHPVAPSALSEAIPSDEQLGTWRWSALSPDVRPIFDLLAPARAGKELLLFAQRQYLARRFPTYDPTDRDTWEEHDRPWDFDHILPSAVSYGVWHSTLKHKELLDEWIWTIGNLRACPMEDNRSDQAEAPKSKMGLDVADSLISRDELEGFQDGFDHRHDLAAVVAFARSARRRLLRIYDAWYGIDGLNVAALL